MCKSYLKPKYQESRNACGIRLTPNQRGGNVCGIRLTPNQGGETSIGTTPDC